ncbi:MAG: glutathione S-transferase family protein [Myxococcota bacterium]
MILLYQFGPAFGLPSISPFCTKVEAYLRMTGTGYRVQRSDPRRAPKGKLPVIDDGENVITDSGFIIEHCKLAMRRDPDDGLDAAARAVGLATRRMLEEHFHWALLYARWIDPAGWEGGFRDAVRAMVPRGLKTVAPAQLRRRVRASLSNQGLGRHDAAEVYALGVSDLDATADLLDGRRYLLRDDAPTSFDATVHAFLGTRPRRRETTP